MKSKDEIIIGRGSVCGTIIEPKDNNHNGRLFDLFIVPDGKDKPMIEFDEKEKNEFSHRGNALRDLISKL
jgi:inosine/xanthosine triphosphate pyrophosphatase family protein